MIQKYVWDKDKDDYVRSRKGGGGYGFQDVVNVIENGGIYLDLYNDKSTYIGQHMFIVLIDNYPYKVPYKKLENGIVYLITMYPCSDLKIFINNYI